MFGVRLPNELKKKKHLHHDFLCMNKRGEGRATGQHLFQGLYVCVHCF